MEEAEYKKCFWGITLRAYERSHKKKRSFWIVGIPRVIPCLSCSLIGTTPQMIAFELA